MENFRGLHKQSNLTSDDKLSNVPNQIASGNV